MECQLFQLFDQQRFQQNPRLAAVIGDVERRYAGVISDDDLEMVSAAGQEHRREQAPGAFPFGPAGENRP